MTASSPPRTILTYREITLHLGGLVLFIGLLVLWYWHSTGARAVPGLIGRLHDPDPSVRVIAADWIGHIGMDAKAAVPSLLSQATRDTVQHANTTAAAALTRIDLAAARQVMVYYLPRLHQPDLQSRRTACAVIGDLGPVAKPAAPALIGLAHDPDELVRRNALSALGTIGLPSRLISDALLAGLHDPSALVRQAAATQFAFTVPLPRAAIEDVKVLAEGQDPAVSNLLRTALAKTTRSDAAQVDTFLLMVGQSMSRNYALHQLARLGPGAITAIPALIPVLQDEQPLHRYLAVEAISATETDAAQVVSALQPLLRDPDPIVRESASAALVAMKPRHSSTRNGPPLLPQESH